MEVPRHWRMKKQRYQMVGEICSSCKTPLFPPRAVCPHCGGDARKELAYREQQPAMAVKEQAELLPR